MLCYILYGLVLFRKGDFCQIQQRAARWVMENYRLTSSVSDLILELNWSTLEQRRYNSVVITASL